MLLSKVQQKKRILVKFLDTEGYTNWEERNIDACLDTLAYCRKTFWKVLLIYEVSKKWELIDAFKEEEF